MKNEDFVRVAKKMKIKTKEEKASSFLFGVCFGVVIGNAGYGIIADNFGWNAVTALWVVFCSIAIVLSIPAVFLWKKFLHTEH